MEPPQSNGKTIKLVNLPTLSKSLNSTKSSLNKNSGDRILRLVNLGNVKNRHSAILPPSSQSGLSTATKNRLQIPRETDDVSRPLIADPPLSLIDGILGTEKCSDIIIPDNEHASELFSKPSRILSLNHIKHPSATTISNISNDDNSITGIAVAPRILNLTSIKTSSVALSLSSSFSVPLLSTSLNTSTKKRKFESYTSQDENTDSDPDAVSETLEQQRLRPNAAFLSRFIGFLERCNSKLPIVGLGATGSVEEEGEEDTSNEDSKYIASQLKLFQMRGKKELMKLAHHYGLHIQISGDSDYDNTGHYPKAFLNEIQQKQKETENEENRGDRAEVRKDVTLPIELVPLNSIDTTLTTTTTTTLPPDKCAVKSQHIVKQKNQVEKRRTTTIPPQPTITTKATTTIVNSSNNENSPTLPMMTMTKSIDPIKSKSKPALATAVPTSSDSTVKGISSSSSAVTRNDVSSQPVTATTAAAAVAGVELKVVTTTLKDSTSAVTDTTRVSKRARISTSTDSRGGSQQQQRQRQQQPAFRLFKQALAAFSTESQK